MFVYTSLILSSKCQERGKKPNDFTAALEAGIHEMITEWNLLDALLCHYALSVSEDPFLAQHRNFLGFSLHKHFYSRDRL